MQLSAILLFSHNNHFSEEIFQQKWFFDQVKPALLLVGTGILKKTPQSLSYKIPTDFQGFSDYPETNYLSETWSPHLSLQNSGKTFQKLLFFFFFSTPGSCSILHSLLLTNLDFCEQTMFPSLARA